MSCFIKVRQFQGQEQIGFLASPPPSKPAPRVSQQALASQELDGDAFGGSGLGGWDPHLALQWLLILTRPCLFVLQTLMEALLCPASEGDGSRL